MQIYDMPINIKFLRWPSVNIFRSRIRQEWNLLFCRGLR